MENQTPQPLITQNPVVQPVVQQPRQLSKITIFSMALFILLSLGSVAFLYYQNQQLKDMLAKYQTPSASPIPTATPDPTANWKTYTNSTKSYSFKYPDGLKLDILAAGIGTESIRFTFIGPLQINSGKIQTGLSDGYSFSVSKIGSSRLLDPKIELEKIDNNSKESCSSVSEVSDIVIAGIKAFQYSGNCLEAYTTSYLSDGKDIYSINQLYTNTNYKLITDQILSTFKFNDQTQTDEITAVQSFANLYAQTFVAANWTKLKTLLTSSAATEMTAKETNLPPTGYSLENYKVVSISKESTGNYIAVIQFIRNGQPLKNPTGDPQIIITKENGQWKSQTWYLYQ